MVHISFDIANIWTEVVNVYLLTVKALKCSNPH